jgi:hypothetical protein
MNPTGRRSRTDSHRRCRRTLRPGTFPGCTRIVAISILAIFLSVPVSAQEVFSWFNRGLLPITFERGDWVRYAVEAIDENGVATDTLTVTVIEVDSARVWLRLQSLSALDFLALDPDRLRPGQNVLDALRRVIHSTAAGLVEEDVDELRASSLVQRHFSDPFESPEIRRRALPDSAVGGVELVRERVDLHEVRRQLAGQFNVVTSLDAEAELAGAIPLLGLLRSRTVIQVTTESASAEATRSRRRPPLLTENSLICIGFGKGAEMSLPAGIQPGN